MFGSLLRAVLLLVLVVAVVVGIGAFFLGYRTGGSRAGEPAPVVGTSGGGETAPGRGAETARQRGAEIGERVGAAAGRAGEALSDGSITAKIKSKIALDDTIKGRDIRVSTSDNVVTLRGEVASAPERDRVVQLARETEGVKSVNDELRIAR